MENGPCIDDFPIEPSIYKGFSMAMLNNQMVYDSIWCMIFDITYVFFYLQQYSWDIWYKMLYNMKYYEILAFNGNRWVFPTENCDLAIVIVEIFCRNS